MKNTLAAFAASVTLAAALAGCSTATTTQPASQPPAPAAPATTAPPAPAAPAPAPPANTATAGQQNALRKAGEYLDSMPFSRTGLIQQLQFDKFSAADATYAVDHVKVDWTEQAAKKAKSYLETQSFSHGSLVDQLVFDGFTPEQAESGVKAAGL